jgi:hypothetical protein
MTIETLHTEALTIGTLHTEALTIRDAAHRSKPQARSAEIGKPRTEVLGTVVLNRRTAVP